MAELARTRTIDPLMMQQHYMLQQSGKEHDDVEKLKNEFNKFLEVSELEEARELAYKLYPKFKDNSNFVVSGVEYAIRDVEDNLRLMAIFQDEIICHEFV